jgi:hypothetical protein
MTVINQPISPREAACAWIADIITKHLHPSLGGPERIQRIAAGIEA